MKIKKLLPFATTWVKHEGVILSEISQRKITPYDVTYTWNLKNQMHGQKYNSMAVARGAGAGGRGR